jgi:hypothetical protein
MFICPKCKRTADENDIFCRSCGIRIEFQGAEEAVDKEVDVLYNEIDESISLRKRDIKVLAILSITVLIFFLAYNYNKAVGDSSSFRGVNNGTNFVSRDNWTYYTYGRVNDDGTIAGAMCKFDDKGSESTKVVDDVANFINVKGQWIYYVSLVKSDFNYQNGEICKVRTDGTERTKLIGEYGEYLTLYKNYLYYKDTGLSPNLNRINLDDSSKETISKDVLSFYINGDFIYYISDSEPGALYKMKLSGGASKKICDIPGPIVYINDNFIYFKEREILTTQNNDNAAMKSSFMGSIGALYRMRVDGTERELIIPDKTTGVYEADKHLYYLISSAMGSRELYKTDLNGKNITKLQLKGDFAGIADNYIYYSEFKDNQLSLYRTDLDFKKVQKIRTEMFDQR